MEGNSNNVEAAIFNIANHAMEQTAKEIEAGGVMQNMKKTTPEPKGEATEEEINAVVSFFPNL